MRSEAPAPLLGGGERLLGRMRNVRLDGSIKFRNENELMEKAEDPEDYYINVIMQEKIKLYLQYVDNASFWYDIKLIFETFKVIVTER